MPRSGSSHWKARLRRSRRTDVAVVVAPVDHRRPRPRPPREVELELNPDESAQNLGRSGGTRAAVRERRQLDGAIERAEGPEHAPHHAGVEFLADVAVTKVQVHLDTVV